MTEMPLLPLLRVQGSHRQVGEQIGEACASAIRESVSFSHGEVPMDGRSMSEQLALAREYRAFTAERLPYLVTELDAVAAGADVDPIRLFAASVEEIWDWEDPPEPVVRSRLTSEVGRCTDLVIGPPATASGSVMVAHNNDLDEFDEPNMVGIEWNVDCEPRMFTAGMGPWISVGWNEAGLLLSGNEVTPNDNRVGIPRLLLVREQLRQATMRAAIDTALHPERASSYNTVYATPDGEAVNIEGSATNAEITDLNDEGYLVHTNHYVCESMVRYEGDPEYAVRSGRRYSRGVDLLEDAARRPGSVTPESL
ncbi:MAG: C45 family autoproteolytic acyltransferase/hydrolase, partial [Actinomycetes bacterium]